jgi:capsular exopolysaccharide synthesis family protein
MSYNDPVLAEDSLRLRQYIGLAWYRKWSIAVLTLLGLMGALRYTKSQTPLFTSTASVIATDPLAAFNPGAFRTGPDMSAEVSVAKSFPVTQCAWQILQNPTYNVLNADITEICNSEELADLVPPPDFGRGVSAGTSPNSTILHLAGTHRSPVTAQQETQAYVLSYAWYKTSIAKAQLTLQTGPIKDQLSKVNKTLSTLESQIAADVTNENSESLSAHLQKRNQVEQQQALLNQQLVDLSPLKIDPPKVTSPATRAAQTSPKKNLNLAAGLALGLLVGLGLAVLRDRLNQNLRGRGDVEAIIGGPVLAVIPHVRKWRRHSATKLMMIEQPSGPVAEAYRTLRTSILFAAAQNEAKVFMITSPLAREGKTTTACNLAVALSEADKRVILVSADLRKPRVHSFFNLSNEKGLSSVLTGEVKAWSLLKDQGMPNLRVIVSGPVPARPGELLQSERMVSLVQELRLIADFVIIDSPPVLMVADPAAMVPMADAVLLVTDAQSTTRGALTQTREALEKVNAPILGAVLNGFDPSKARAYDYNREYGYGYGHRFYYGKAYYGEERDNGEGGKRRSRLALEPDSDTVDQH